MREQSIPTRTKLRVSGKEPLAMSALRRPMSLLVACLVLTACVVSGDRTIDKETGFLKELPEQVAALAAPYQNLQEVMLSPEDGCYWYRHVGPVETTMLPLRTVEGRPICMQAEA